MDADRRSGDASSRTHGRRWADDPDLRLHFERLMVWVSRDLHMLREAAEIHHQFIIVKYKQTLVR